MLGKTVGVGKMELLHDMMEGRDYGQLKDLISDRSRWRQDSKWDSMSETCWKQQKTKEEVRQSCCQLIHIHSLDTAAESEVGLCNIEIYILNYIWTEICILKSLCPLASCLTATLCCAHDLTPLSDGLPMQQKSYCWVDMSDTRGVTSIFAAYGKCDAKFGAGR